MKNVYKIFIAISLFVSGVALVPFVGLPTVGFSWQRYAGAYAPAILLVNHPSGAPGSFFSVSGSSFTPDSIVNVSANGVLLGTVTADSTGVLAFEIDSSGASLGTYILEATGAETGLAQFDLRQGDPVWPQAGDDLIFSLPPDIAVNLVRLPVIIRP